MNWHLQRIYLPDATVGVLMGNGHRFVTLEDADTGDRADSCVREYAYTLVPHSGPKYPDTFALVGGTVSHMPQAGMARSAVLFHWGNTTRDTLGCILVGTSLVFSPAPTVTGSKDAFAKWLEATKAAPGPHTLTITKG